MLDGGNPWGIGEYFKVDYLEELPDDAIDTWIDQAAGVASPFTQIILAPLGGAASRTDRDAMALNAPNTKWFYFYLAMWMDPSLADAERDRARAFMEAMKPWSAGKAPLELRLIRRGRGPAAGVVRRREVRAAPGAQGQVRPGQPLRAEPEHPAERRVHLAGAVVSAGARASRR